MGSLLSRRMKLIKKILINHFIRDTAKKEDNSNPDAGIENIKVKEKI